MKKFNPFLLITLLFIFSCKSNKTDSTSDIVEESEDVMAVCVYDYSPNGLQVLKDYNDPKSHLTYVKLGEAVTFLGDIETDSNSKKEYCKIELSDGSVGWARKDYIIENAKPAAIMAATPVYERPDILTKSSKKKFDEIDIVALVDEKDEWYQVVGRNNLNKGWIMKENLSLNKEDVGMAILARKELFDEKGNLKEDKLLDFVNNAPYPGSSIVTILRNKAVDNVEQEALESQQPDSALIEDEDMGIE